MPADIKVRGTEEFRRLARDLKEAGQVELRKSMGKRMRGAIKPIVPDMRREIRQIPSKGQDKERSKKAINERPMGLREATARGVQVKISYSGTRVGARIRIDPRHFPPGQKALPKFLDGTIPQWKHAVYGTGTMVNQRQHPFFLRTIRKHEDRATHEIAQILEDVSSQLTKG